MAQVAFNDEKSSIINPGSGSRTVTSLSNTKGRFYGPLKTHLRIIQYGSRGAIKGGRSNGPTLSRRILRLSAVQRTINDIMDTVRLSDLNRNRVPYAHKHADGLRDEIFLKKRPSNT